MACLLATFCGIGVGHYYAGLRRRALGWLGAEAASAIVLVFALLLSQSAAWAIFALIVVFFLAWVGPFVDLCVVPERRFSRVPLWQVVGYAVAVPLGWAVLSFGLRSFLLEAFKISSGAMTPTLLIGDHIFVDKRTSGQAERSDVIVFRHPERPNEDYLKRAIGMPGDVIQVKDGQLFINGWPVPRCPLGQVATGDDARGETGTVALEFLAGRAYLTLSVSDQNADGTWTVGPGESFVLGDFRTNSADSRSWFGGRGGGVPLAYVKGRGIGIWLNVTDQSSDWSRMGVSLGEPALPSSMRDLEPALEKCLRERPSDVETRPPVNMMR